MSRAPIVSVIVPAFNAADHLALSVGRLLGQSLTDIEIVLVDDGSSDATASVAARLADEDPRVRVFSLPENRGVARAREHAVSHSRGDYVWFVDADDRAAPDALHRLVAAARAADADVVVCSAQFVEDGGRIRPLPAPRIAGTVSGRRAFRLLLTGDITGHLWNKLFRRDLAARITFTPARVHSDLAMVAQLLASARRVAAIPDVLYSYLLRGGSIIHAGSRRAESLALVDDAVRAAAARTDPRILKTSEYRSFRFRFILLSGLKDAVLGPYSAAERAALVPRIRAEIRWRMLLVAARTGDGRRLALGLAAKTSLPLYRRVLHLAESRVRPANAPYPKTGLTGRSGGGGVHGHP